MSFDRIKNQLENAIKEVEQDKAKVVAFGDAFKRIVNPKLENSGIDDEIILTGVEIRELLVFFHEMDFSRV